MVELTADGSDEGTPSAGEEEILGELARALRRLPDPVVLRFVRHQGWIREALEDHAAVGLGVAVGTLLARYKEASALRASGRELLERWATGEASGDDVRGRALARIFAIDAAGGPVVSAYRTRYLPKGRIERDEVGSWVRSRRAIGLRTARRTTRPEPGWRVASVELIAYLEPDSPWAKHVLVPEQGALRDLKFLAGRLMSRYGWIEAEAVTFVLTGLPPWLPRIRASTVERMPWTSASIIELRVSPRASPGEVAATYRKVRAKLIGVDRRRKDMQSPERAELAVFAFERADGRSWRSIMDEWNEQASTTYRRYADVRSYARDARSAFRAITGTELS